VREMNAPVESAWNHRWIAKERTLQLADISLLFTCVARPQPCILDHSSALHQFHWCSQHRSAQTVRLAGQPSTHREDLELLFNHIMAQPGSSNPERAQSGGESAGGRRQRVQPGEPPSGAAATHEGGLEESSESSDPLLHTPEV
jgi:hypothetical protein